MSTRLELFCEDAAHESCARGLIMRCAREEGIAVNVHVASARFGIPRVKTELGAFQRVVHRRAGAPDVLVVVVDANDVGVADRHDEVSGTIDYEIFPDVVIGVPNPCVERWLLADPRSFAGLFGVGPESSAVGPCRVWKQRLVDTLEASGQIVTQGGAEFAEEIVEAMDLYRAGRVEPTLGAFVDDVRAALRRHTL